MGSPVLNSAEWTFSTYHWSLLLCLMQLCVILPMEYEHYLKSQARKSKAPNNKKKEAVRKRLSLLKKWKNQKQPHISLKPREYTIFRSTKASCKFRVDTSLREGDLFSCFLRMNLFLQSKIRFQSMTHSFLNIVHGTNSPEPDLAYWWQWLKLNNESFPFLLLRLN